MRRSSARPPPSRIQQKNEKKCVHFLLKSERKKSETKRIENFKAFDWSSVHTVHFIVILWGVDMFSLSPFSVLQLNGWMGFKAILAFRFQKAMTINDQQNPETKTQLLRFYTHSERGREKVQYSTYQFIHMYTTGRNGRIFIPQPRLNHDLQSTFAIALNDFYDAIARNEISIFWSFLIQAAITFCQNTFCIWNEQMTPISFFILLFVFSLCISFTLSHWSFAFAMCCFLS